MSDFDALRPLFDDLVGQPPMVLGRKEAVMNRVTRRLQRQAALRGVAALAVISVLGVGAVKTSHTFSNTSSDGHEQTVVATDPPSPSAAPKAVVEPTHEPSHEPSPAPTHEPSKPPATTAPEPTHSSAPVTEPTHGPTPENTAAAGPLTVSATMSPSTVGTNTDVRAYVTARDGEGRLLAVDITWGDGQTFHFAPTGDATCPRTTHLDGSFVHRYTTAGSYAVHVTVTSGDCAPQEKVTAETHVTVTAPEPSPTATSTNGPAAPVAQIASRSGDNPAYTYVYAGGSDDDGWISRIVIHWGDGSESAYPYSTSGCTNASGTDHPVKNTQTTSVPGGHQYASSGSHTVTATVTSVACDGTHAQTDTASLTVTS